MKKVLPFAIVLVFFLGLCTVPQVGDSPFIQDLRKDSISTLSEGVERNIRVAIYNEANTSVVASSYTACPYFTNHIQPTADLLTGAGYDVTLITTDDILNHELLTVNYDVFVLVNNVPHDSIYDYVLEFWLGGGGILSFNGGFGFLQFSGIFSPDWAGVDEFASDWLYPFMAGPIPDNYTIMSRFPTHKDYHIGDLIVADLNDTVVWNPAYLGVSNAAEFTPIASSSSATTLGVNLAIEPIARGGGRAVQLAGNGSYILPAFESIIIDSVDWLTPRPKGRIVFDLSHQPRLGVDLWDTMTAYPNYYSDMRNLLEMSGYTFDKLYPKASGNLTTARLSPFDMLILVSPDFNYTAPEIAGVQSWVASGGGLLVMGESPTWGPFVQASDQINLLMDDFDMELGMYDYVTVTASYAEHPVTEACTAVSYTAVGFVNHTGNTFRITYDGTNTFSAGEVYGNGRAVLIADQNFPTNTFLGDDTNERFIQNLACWLTASQARVLYYTNEISFGYGMTPGELALKDLGVDYYMTTTSSALNMSLQMYSWDLVIIDAPWLPGFTAYMDDINAYLDTGGKLIMSFYYANTVPDHPMWSRIGFGVVGNIPNLPPMYIWEGSHGVFNTPNNYNAANFTPTTDYGDEGDNLTVYSNATALGGLSPSVQSSNASIVLGLAGRVLYNAYLIDELQGDFDDSTYMDSYELWENEIAFMLQPTLDHPADVEYEEGTIGHSIDWASSSEIPWTYVIERDSVTVDSGSWNGGPLSINIDGLANGTYVYEITVFDNVGYSASDSVNVNVTAVPPTTPTTGPGAPLDLTTLLIIIGAAGVVIIIVLVVVMRKKK